MKQKTRQVIGRKSVNINSIKNKTNKSFVENFWEIKWV